MASTSTPSIMEGAGEEAFPPPPPVVPRTDDDDNTGAYADPSIVGTTSDDEEQEHEASSIPSSTTDDTAAPALFTGSGDGSSAGGNNNAADETAGTSTSPNSSRPAHQRRLLLERAGKAVRERGAEAKTKGAMAGAMLHSRLAKGFEKIATVNKKNQQQPGSEGGGGGSLAGGIANSVKSIRHGLVRARSRRSDDDDEDDDDDEGGRKDGSSKSEGGGGDGAADSMCRSDGAAATRVGGIKNHDSAVTFSDETTFGPEGEGLTSSEGGRVSAASAAMVLLTDNLILWVMAFAIATNATYEHWDRIVMENSFPLSAVLAWMFFAFTLGVEIDSVAFYDEIKNSIFGLKVENDDEATDNNSLGGARSSTIRSLSDGDPGTPKELKKKNFFQRMFNKNACMVVSLGKLPGVKEVQRTALRRKQNRSNQIQKENRALNNTDFLRRLERFGHHMEHTLCLDKRHERRKADGPTASDSTLDASSSTESLMQTTPEGLLKRQTSQLSAKSDYSMGKTLSQDSSATTLLQKVVQPQCDLRGLDLFRTDNAETDMLTHPFLIKNGLRDFQTFMINILTVYGNIIVYFKLPDWVQDWGDSLVEKEEDPMSVKALKRFLSGDDDYRRRSFKVMPELVVGPAAVKMMAPRNREFCLEMSPFMLTTYQQEAPTGSMCPAMSLTLDLVTNSTMRGLVGIFKRNMSYMTVDFACVIDAKEEDGATCVVGLWRMDRLVVEEYPFLPDRFATSGVSNETIDTIRGSLLVKSWVEAATSKAAVEGHPVVSEEEDD